MEATETKVRSLAAERSCQAVRFFLPSLAPELKALRYSESILADWGFSFGARGDSLDYEASFGTVVNLRNETGEILRDFSKGQRANVMRCRKIGLNTSIYQGPSFSDHEWRSFAEIHTATFVRNGRRPFSAERLEYLAKMVSRGFLALATTKSDASAVSAVLLETYKKGVYYLAGGSTEFGLKIGAMAFTQYSAMEWAKMSGYTDYLIGMTVPIERGSKAGQIGAFKSHFGSERWDHLAGELILDRRAYARKILMPAILEISGLKPKAVGFIAQRIRSILR